MTQPYNRLRRVCGVQVGIEHWEFGEILDVDLHLGRRELLRGPEEGSIERGLPQTPSYPDDPEAPIAGDRFAHPDLRGSLAAEGKWGVNLGRHRQVGRHTGETAVSARR